MLALRNEERSLRQMLFFAELEERDALAALIPKSTPSQRRSATLPVHYVDLCQRLASHVSSGRELSLPSDNGENKAALTEVPGGGERRSYVRELTFPRDPATIDLTLPVLATTKATCHQETSTATGEQRASLGGNAQSGLDARIAHLCDEKYGPFQVYTKDAEYVARDVLLRDGIVW